MIGTVITTAIRTPPSPSSVGDTDIGWESALDQLRAAVTGPVVTRLDPGYSAEVAAFDLGLRYRPRIAVGARTVADVSVALATCSRHRLKVGVVGTAHAGVGPTDSDVLITTRRLDSVVVDAGSGTVTVGPGATWADVLAAATPHGLAPVCGSAPDVGVIGLLLGGGLGPVARTFGFSSDYVVSLQLIALDGSVLDVDAHHHPDLFWALRGGKGGLGVVTSATITLLPTPTLYGGGLYFAADDADAVVHGYCAWLAEPVPDALTTSMALTRFPPSPLLPEPLRGRFIVHVRAVYVGNSTDGQALIAPLRALGTPVLDTVAKMPYAEIGSIHHDPSTPMAISSGGILLATVDHAAADTLLTAAGPDAAAALSIVELRHLGGALRRAPGVPDAASGRAAAVALFVASSPLTDVTARTRSDATAAVRRVLDEEQPWSTGGTQINFFGPVNTPGEFAGSWAPAALERLAGIRRALDPHGLMPFGPQQETAADPQSVTSPSAVDLGGIVTSDANCVTPNVVVT